MTNKHPIKDCFGQIFKYISLFLFGGLLYYSLECCFRGYSHWSMIITAGSSFIYIGLLNEITPWDEPLITQFLKAWVFTLTAEFITGCIVNLWLGWNVWDYSNLPGNILGQTSWQFALLFAPLCLLGIFLDDYIRWRFFGEEIPHYVWF